MCDQFNPPYVTKYGHLDCWRMLPGNMSVMMFSFELLCWGYFYWVGSLRTVSEVCKWGYNFMSTNHIRRRVSENNLQITGLIKLYPHLQFISVTSLELLIFFFQVWSSWSSLVVISITLSAILLHLGCEPTYLINKTYSIWLIHLVVSISQNQT